MHCIPAHKVVGDIGAPAANIEACVRGLAVEFPQLGLSFGYIGNVGRGYDDRGWRVFTTVRRDNRSQSWGDWPTDQLPAMYEAIATGRLRLFCESLAASL
jgi:hypothetical protein